MANALRKPEVLSFEGKCAENWRVFELECGIYVEAAHPAAETKTRAYILLNLAGIRMKEQVRLHTLKMNQKKIQLA